MSPRPTAAQLAALRLAARDALRYYRGGWYSIPAVAGNDQNKFGNVVPIAESTTIGTLRACVARGWLVEGDDGDAWEQPIIYSTRWTLTDLGRAVLDAAKGADK